MLLWTCLHFSWITNLEMNILDQRARCRLLEIAQLLPKTHQQNLHIWWWIMLSTISYACGQSSSFYSVLSDLSSVFSVGCFVSLCFRISLYILHTCTLQDTCLWIFSQFVACLLIFLCLLVNRKLLFLWSLVYLVFGFIVILYTWPCLLQRDSFTFSFLTWISFSCLIAWLKSPVKYWIEMVRVDTLPYFWP